MSKLGSTPAGTTQAFPASGSTAPLVEGTTYFLYVSCDIYQPLTRCLFTF